MAFSTSTVGPLDDLVLQRGDAERPSAARRPWGCTPCEPASPGTLPASAVRRGPGGSPPGPPRSAATSRRPRPAAASRFRAKYAARSVLDVVDVVQERGEPHLPVPSCCLTYPLQRTGRAVPALCPGRVLLARVPLGQPPSLHPLRRRLPGLVRRLRRYYGPVRLPASVHHRRASLDFPTRPAAPSAAGGHGISRFPREVFPRMHGVSDRAGLRRVSRYRRTGCGLPLLLQRRHPGGSVLSRLNTRPARTPVNASPPPSRAPPHDSGPVWVASPSPYDSFIHNTSPVYPGAQGEPHDGRSARLATTGPEGGGRDRDRHDEPVVAGQQEPCAAGEEAHLLAAPEFHPDRGRAAEGAGLRVREVGRDEGRGGRVLGRRQRRRSTPEAVGRASRRATRPT